MSTFELQRSLSANELSVDGLNLRDAGLAGLVPPDLPSGLNDIDKKLYTLLYATACNLIDSEECDPSDAVDRALKQLGAGAARESHESITYRRYSASVRACVVKDRGLKRVASPLMPRAGGGAHHRQNLEKNASPLGRRSSNSAVALSTGPLS